MLTACALLLAAPSLAVAHPDPFGPDHAHASQRAEDSSNAAVAVGAVVLMLATAGALVGLKRAGRR